MALNHPSVFLDIKNENSFSVDSVRVEISEGIGQTARNTENLTFTLYFSWLIVDQDVADSLITLIKYTFSQMSN